MGGFRPDMRELPADSFRQAFVCVDQLQAAKAEAGDLLAAEKEFEPGTVPDGFYLVDDAANPQPGFKRYILEQVAKVTHIAPADQNGEIIGSPVAAPGVILCAMKALGLCTGISNARYTTTTEVYPDSPRVTPDVCCEAQAVTVCAAIDYALLPH